MCSAPSARCPRCLNRIIRSPPAPAATARSRSPPTLVKGAHSLARKRRRRTPGLIPDPGSPELRLPPHAPLVRKPDREEAAWPGPMVPSKSGPLVHSATPHLRLSWTAPRLPGGSWSQRGSMLGWRSLRHCAALSGLLPYLPVARRSSWSAVNTLSPSPWSTRPVEFVGAALQTAGPQGGGSFGPDGLADRMVQ